MIFWLLYPIIEAFVQAYFIKLGNKPNYLQLFILRGWIAILFGAIVLDPMTSVEGFLIITFQCTSFWLIFDPVLNKLRNKPFTYKGKDSGWLDKLPTGIYWSLKVVALVVAVISYYLYGINFR